MDEWISSFTDTEHLLQNIPSSVMGSQNNNQLHELSDDHASASDWNGKED